MALNIWPNCFVIQYMIAFMSLLLLANLSSIFDTILSFVGKILVLSVISWYSLKTIKQLVNKKFINPNKRAVIITGKWTGGHRSFSVNLASCGDVFF